LSSPACITNNGTSSNLSIFSYASFIAFSSSLYQRMETFFTINGSFASFFNCSLLRVADGLFGVFLILILILAAIGFKTLVATLTAFGGGCKIPRQGEDNITACTDNCFSVNTR